MGRGLVGDEVGHDAAREQPLEQVDGVRLDADRDGPTGVARREGAVDRAIESRLPLVEVARPQALLDPLGVHLRDERVGAVHRRRERLRAAHAAEARRHDEAAREIAAEVPAPPPRRTSRRSPARSPGCRCRSRSRPSSGRTSSGPGPRGGGTRRPSPTPARASSSRSGPAARPRASRRRRRPCPTGRASSRWLEPLQRRDDRVEALPAARGAAGSAVDDELVGLLGDVRIEVVLEHPEGGFLGPAAAAQLGAAGRADRPRAARSCRVMARIIWRRRSRTRLREARDRAVHGLVGEEPRGRSR